MNTATVDKPTSDTDDAYRGFMRQLIRNMSGLTIAYPDSPLAAPGDENQVRVHDLESDSTRSPLSILNPPAGPLYARLLRTSARHLLVFAGSDHAASQDQVSPRRPDHCRHGWTNHDQPATSAG